MAYDRGEKFAHDRRIPSLREYLLVSQREPRQTLVLRSLDGVQLPADAIYRDPLVGG